ncbi:hypothetical protein FRC17_009566 [Serendipita sp. 399]|nr:hypothetical protein FRC17_009566 [Serendipita sp. 399]
MGFTFGRISRNAVHRVARVASIASNFFKGSDGESASTTSTTSTSYTWDTVPFLVKVIFAFEVLWFILFFFQFVFILVRLKVVKSSNSSTNPARRSSRMRKRVSKAPYLLAAFVAGSLSLLYVLSAAHTRLTSTTTSQIPTQTGTGPGDGTSGASSTEERHVRRRQIRILQLESVIRYFFNIDISFRPFILLWLCHLRGILPTTATAAAAAPGSSSSATTTEEKHATKKKDSFVASMRKQIFDNVFVTVVFIVSDGFAAYTTWVNGAAYDGKLTQPEEQHARGILKSINRVVIALVVLLTINVLVSLIALKVSQKRAKVVDPVVNRLLLISLPFVLLDALETPVAEIFMATQDDYDALGFSLALIVLEGFSRLMVLVGVISTMNVIADDDDNSSRSRGEYDALEDAEEAHPQASSSFSSSMPPPPQYEGPDPRTRVREYPDQVPYDSPSTGQPLKY